MSEKTYTERTQELSEQVEARGWRSKLRENWYIRDIATMNRAEVIHYLLCRLVGFAQAADQDKRRRDTRYLETSAQRRAAVRRLEDMQAQRDALAENLKKIEGAHAEEVGRLQARLQTDHAAVRAALNGEDPYPCGYIGREVETLRMELLKRAEAAEAEVERLTVMLKRIQGASGVDDCEAPSPLVSLVISTGGDWPDTSDLCPGGKVATIKAFGSLPTPPPTGFDSLGSILVNVEEGENCVVYLSRKDGNQPPARVCYRLTKEERSTWFRGIWDVRDRVELLSRMTCLFGDGEPTS